MTQDSYLRFAAMVAAAGGIALALNLIWRHVICPIYRFIILIADFTEAQPVLLEIAEEFKPNNGTTLRDQIDTANMRLSNIEGQMEIVVQHVSGWNGDERRIS